MRRFYMFLIVASFVLSTSFVYASYTCSGPVTGVTLGTDGSVAAASAGGLTWPIFCRIGDTANGISPDVCKAIYAGLLAAQLNGKNVLLWFNDC